MEKKLLAFFLVIKTLAFLFERFLSWLNRNHRNDPDIQKEACTYLGLDSSELNTSIAYAEDKYRFGLLSESFDFFILMLVIASGFLGWIEHGVLVWLTKVAGFLSLPVNESCVGLGFLAALGIMGTALNLPFQYYFTFVLEAKHGFNRQTHRDFWMDQVKMLGISVLLGGPFLFALLWVMQHMGQSWWLWAWGVVVFFSVFATWIYPTWIAPLFNKFSPLPEGELKTKILEMATKVGFSTAGLSVMDASKRSSHGNAYFTGIFGKKKIVLFDTLIQMLTTPQIVAVLAHELGHFKLHHIRNSLIRSILFTGLIFWILKMVIPIDVFYQAFGFSSRSSYAALVVFALWFGPIEILLKPFVSYLSRQNEFAADAFAKSSVGDGKDLAEALLTMREKSHVVPITHPLFSLFYYSHPPIIERLKQLKG